ncbi:hypothetical protein FRC00_005360 [Tulasnella sp. 408]|nr:hypothetical protein FRC00_005360 [Tulasnella sp. 408]
MADLLAYQFDDADDGEATAKSREDRKRRAFLESKISYPLEPVVILPGVGAKVFDQRDAENRSEPVILVVHGIYKRSGKLFCGTRRKELLAVQHLYLHREYHRALDVSLAVMDKMTASDAPGNKASSHSRELQDLALRSAIRTGQGEIAARLADQTSSRWEAMQGSAASAGEAYLLADRPRDAISALLAATKNRPHLHHYLLPLAKAFQMLADRLKLDDHERVSPYRAITSLVRSLKEAAQADM